MQKPESSPDTFLATRFGLGGGDLTATLNGALERRADFADLYFELRENAHVSLEEGIVKRATSSISQGVGVRVLAGEKTGFAYSDDVSVDSLALAARSARAIADGNGSAQPVPVSTRPARPTADLYPVPENGVSRPLPERIDLLEAIDREARAFDPRISNVMANVAVEELSLIHI